MSTTRTCIMRWMATLLVTTALVGTASAAPPPHAGGPHNKGHGPWHARHAGNPGRSHHGGPGLHAQRNEDIDVDVFFDEREREIIRDYYLSRWGGGFCPPGLAKKNNGCMPPGQAKKWAVGQRLPDYVDYYNVPHELAERLGYDSPAYKLIRVGAAILRVAVDNGVVVEALEILDGPY